MLKPLLNFSYPEKKLFNFNFTGVKLKRTNVFFVDSEVLQAFNDNSKFSIGNYFFVTTFIISEVLAAPMLIHFNF